MFRPLWRAALAGLMLAMPFLATGPARAQDAALGIDGANLDLSVSPRQDFYVFANGGWLDRTVIPADEGAYTTFTQLHDVTTKELLAMLDEVVAGERELVEGSDEWKAARLWQQGVDAETRNALGIEPIVPLLDEIAAISDLADYHDYQRQAMFRGVSGSLGIGVGPDLRDSGINAVYLGGPWLGMPNRDYYLEDDEANEAVRAAYNTANARFLERMGADPEQSVAAAQAVYDLEKRLAATTLTREQSQNPEASYNPATVVELQERYPAMDWQAYLDDLGISDTERIIVTEVSYVDELAAILTETPIETLRDYLRLQLIWNFFNNLDLELEETAFDYVTALTGQAEMKPIEERALGQVNGLMGDALGQIYVAEYFPPAAKEEITQLTERIVAAFRARLEANDWMTPETRQRALAKLDTLRIKVGYPDKWETYEDVAIGESYAESAQSAANAALRESLAEAGQPVDRDEWGMNAQTANAYYSPLNNEIVFPAAILQSPFFDYEADDASNLGGIGVIIGHEITHGFDLSGSRFDEIGNLSDWWTATDRARFEDLNDELVAQYNDIEVLPGLFVDGQLTVTENVADLGGVETAFDALQTLLQEREPEESAADLAGFTPEERFFIAAATAWRAKTRDEALITRVRSDSHAPSSVRATQPLRNVDDFFETFDIVEGDPMYLAPAERVRLW